MKIKGETDSFSRYCCAAFFYFACRISLYTVFRFLDLITMGGDVIADMHYLTHTTDGLPPQTDLRPTSPWSTPNFGQTPTRVTIHDLRDKETTVDLDTNAFEVLKTESSVQEEFDEGSDAQKTCYAEIAAVLKNHLAASRVVLYNHVFRYRGRPLTVEQGDGLHRNPVYYPHVDIDTDGVRKKMALVLGAEEAKKAMQKRFQVMNIWRPVGPNPITDKPLTLCDYRSIDVEKDVHPMQVIGSLNTTTGYTISCSGQKAHKWYYLSHMRSNEIFIFKMFDSKADVAQFAFHTGFLNEDEPPSDVEQKSIEMRCFVFYD